MPVYYPYVKVSIYPIDGSQPFTFEKGKNPSDDIRSINIAKTLDGAQGSFTIDLVQRPVRGILPWHRVLRANDLVVIEQKRGGVRGEIGNLHTTLIGLIDRTSAVEVVGSNGKLNYVSRVFGSDMGKLLHTHYMHFFKYFGPLAALGLFSIDEKAASMLFHSRKPAEFLENYWEGFTDRIWDFDLQTPEGLKRPIEFINIDFTSLEAVIPYDFTIYNREGDIWSLFKQLSEPALHELFLTLSPPGTGIFGSDKVNPLLVLRPTDFSGSGVVIKEGVITSGGKFEERDVIEVSSEQLEEQKASETGSPFEQSRGPGEQFIIDDDELVPSGADAYENSLSRGDGEVLTVISMKSHLYGTDQAIADVVMPVIVNKKFFKQFGYREFTAETRLIPDSLKDSFDQAVIYTRKLTDWFNANLWFWSGEKTIGFRPEIRVGTELVDKRARGGVFKAYITGYTHSWQIGGPATTKITFTRGVFENNEIDTGEWILLRIEGNVSKKLDLMNNSQPTIDATP